VGSSMLLASGERERQATENRKRNKTSSTPRPKVSIDIQYKTSVKSGPLLTLERTGDGGTRSGSASRNSLGRRAIGQRRARRGRQGSLSRLSTS
jgi:hypothetical protein